VRFKFGNSRVVCTTAIQAYNQQLKSFITLHRAFYEQTAEGMLM